MKIFAACPECGSPKIRYAGLGTEKIEAVAGAVFHGCGRLIFTDEMTLKGEDDDEVGNGG